MGVASGSGEQEVGVASGSGWNVWVWLLGVVVRRCIDFLILLIPTPLVSVLFYSSIPSFKKKYIYQNDARHPAWFHPPTMCLLQHIASYYVLCNRSSNNCAY